MLSQEEAIGVIKRKLREYLEGKGIEIPLVGNFRCPIPGCGHKNNDQSPSAGFIPRSEDTLVHCFKSQRTYDIFHLFAMEKGLPLDGIGFFMETLPAIASEFNIEYAADTMSKDQKVRYKMLKAYTDAMRTITSNQEVISQQLKEFAKTKLGEGETEPFWKPETALQLGIGTIESFDIYKNAMLEHWDEAYLESIELLNTRIFNTNNLIFTIFSPRGEPIAFVARNLKYEQERAEGDAQKFYNSHTSPIYKKGNILYGFNFGRAHCALHPIWVFEGYGDFVTAWEAGLKNSCAIGATAFTQEHLDQLITSSASRYIMVMDGDKAGIEATTRIVEKFCKGGIDITIKFVLVPEGLDGDEYIRKYGLGRFLELRKYSAFEWALEYSDIKDPEKLTEHMIELIVSETNNVNQHYFAKILSEKMNIPYNVIMLEIERRRLVNDNEKAGKMNYVLSLMDQRLRHGELPRTALHDALQKIEEIEDSYNIKIDPENQYDQSIIKLKDHLLLQPENPGFEFGKTINPMTGEEIEVFPNMHTHLDGLPDYACLISIGANPGVGKTSWLRFLTFHIAMSNPDVRVIFMSIDDSKIKILQGIVAFTQNIPIAKVRKPGKLDESTLRRWSYGWDLIREHKKRFIVHDSVDGTTTDHLEQYIKHSIKNYPNQKPIIVLDNFHKLTDFMSQDPKIKNAICSERLKYLTVKYEVPIFMTVELRKGQSIYSEPTMLDLKDTVQISYDTDYVWLMHNDFHLNRESSWVWYDPTEQRDELIAPEPRPILKLIVSKNKETDFKGNFYFKFRDYSGQFFELTKAELDDIKSKVRTPAANTTGQTRAERL